MNTCCDAEFEGQYLRDGSKAIVGCRRPDCTRLRKECIKPKKIKFEINILSLEREEVRDTIA